MHGPLAATQQRGAWTCVLLHVWGRFSSMEAACWGQGWDGRTCMEGMGLSLHHFLYFLTFELCKYTTQFKKERQKTPEKIGFLKTFASWTVKTALS